MFDKICQKISIYNIPKQTKNSSWSSAIHNHLKQTISSTHWVPNCELSQAVKRPNKAEAWLATANLIWVDSVTTTSVLHSSQCSPTRQQLTTNPYTPQASTPREPRRGERSKKHPPTAATHTGGRTEPADPEETAQKGGGNKDAKVKGDSLELQSSD